LTANTPEATRGKFLVTENCLRLPLIRLANNDRNDTVLGVAHGFRPVKSEPATST